jgi:hypothetical protein
MNMSSDVRSVFLYTLQKYVKNFHTNSLLMALIRAEYVAEFSYRI